MFMHYDDDDDVLMLNMYAHNHPIWQEIFLNNKGTEILI